MARQVILFRNRLRPFVQPAFDRSADGVYAIAVTMPGFLSSKDFIADDGERLSVIEFETPEQLRAWREQPDHKRAQEEGRARWFSEYRIQVCELVREATFTGEPEREAQPPAVDVSGGCACGAVRYRARGLPRDQTLCHCSDCRRAAGAPAVGWATFDTDQVEWTGTLSERRSSERALRGFCAQCGTQLSFRRVGDTTELDLTLGSLDDPNAIAPRDHTYTRSQVSWLHISDGLPRFEAARPK